MSQRLHILFIDFSTKFHEKLCAIRRELCPKKRNVYRQSMFLLEKILMK